jgi:hypothetical protein
MLQARNDFESLIGGKVGLILRLFVLNMIGATTFGRMTSTRRVALRGGKLNKMPLSKGWHSAEQHSADNT